ncbi:hypothetical protein LSH36_272g05058 [Paralvinella palmiformis]|uniref:Uncharacterized protein n=1 Tax=Paralvinella palmiformis TaxID=53620 RepID=A0AAD9JJD2_9ANNE|nr:hypothetical protein LSH36_272g05058 [Paralvinella palmiformis]
MSSSQETYVCTELEYPIGCDYFNSTNPEDMTTIMDQMAEFAIYYVIIGCCVLLIGYLHVLGWLTAAYNQGHRIRKKLFWSILKQDIAWFDTHDIGELNTRLSDDVAKLVAGIGDKMGLFFQYTSTFVTGIIIAFVYSWKLALVMTSVSPLIAMAGMVMAKVGASMTSKELQAYAKAGAVAEEVIGAVRTVMAFGGEEKECNRYNENLKEAKLLGIRKGLLNGVSMGLIFLIMFSSYGLAFWYGSKLVFDGEITPGTIMTVFFCVLSGTFSLGNAAPNIEHFATARGAAYVLYQDNRQGKRRSHLQRRRIKDSIMYCHWDWTRESVSMSLAIIDIILFPKPDIDSSAPSGRKEEHITGNVEFKNVDFNYPSRPDVKVLKNLSMKIQVGQTLALVGPSGCGKSTTVQLLQRFYDPEAGQILMDGTDIREFNIKWYRQQIAVVSQEPILFATTISENVRFGKDDITNEDIVRACREANAEGFISKLPEKYETLVGERGAQLSGGQKQRIAIARALVRNPKVLILDEATSALDTESEATVQEALDKARQGRTILIIAHRLSTIKNAHVIVGVKDGVVVERGTHDELMAKQGLYSELVNNQQNEKDDPELFQKHDLVRGGSLRISGYGKGRSSSIRSISSVGSKKSSDKQETEEALPIPPVKRLMGLNRPEMPLLIMGCIFAIMLGGVQPSIAIIMSEILGVFSETGDHVQDEVNLYSGMFVVVGVGAGICMTLLSVTFSRSGEALTLRLRQQSFQSILRQEMAFFDDNKNSVGALCTRLATDASAVKGATGTPLSTFFRSLASIGAGIIIGFVYSWEMTLLILGIVPFVFIGGYTSMKIRSSNTEDKNKGLEHAGKIAIEAIGNIRTVATLTKEQRFFDDYSEAILKQYKNKKREAHIQGIAYAFSQAVMYFAIAASFSLGAYLVENRGLEYQDMYRVFSAIVFSALQVGQATSFAPDYGEAKVSAAKIFALLDRKSAIDSSDPDGKKLNDCSGAVKLMNVSFNYPSRPDVTVLKDLRLTVNPGQTVALVGTSGCGKSTMVQLLERFYDPFDGQVTFEDTDIRQLNLQWLRKQIGIVSQEPILFATSIRDNIAYGENSRKVEMAEIIQAAKNANIHNFITSLPEGYDTNVGDKGAQLSGGQKQRIAIARALIRNPKLLLLDEATSALDTESEKIVQTALDKAQEGRTCIVIAHRLSTIQNADCIVVIHQGRVVEMGTHSELLQQRSRASQPEYYLYQHCYQEGGSCDMKEMVCDNDTVINVTWSVIGYSEYWQYGDRSNCSITNDTCYMEIDEPTYNCSGLTVCSLDTCSDSTWEAITCSTTVATNFMRINYTCEEGRASQPEYYLYQHCYQEGGSCDMKEMVCDNDTVINVTWSVIGYSEYWQYGDRSNCSITNDTCYMEIDEPTYNCSGLTVCILDTCSDSTWEVITCSTTVATNFMRINYTCEEELLTTKDDPETTQDEDNNMLTILLVSLIVLIVIAMIIVVAVLMKRRTVYVVNSNMYNLIGRRKERDKQEREEFDLPGKSAVA